MVSSAEPPHPLYAISAGIPRRRRLRPSASKVIHAIVDNYAGHKHANVRACLARNPRWTFHFTPSWLNAVEGFFSTLTRRRLERGVFQSIVELQIAINRFIDERNQQSRPFTWTADPQRVLAPSIAGIIS